MDKHIHRFHWIIIGLLTFSLSCWAQDAFDPKEANALLDKLSIKLSIAQPTAKILQEAANTLIEQQSLAKECVAQAEKEIADYDALLPKSVEEIELSKDQKFLIEKKTNLESRLAECRLFVLRAEEAIQAFSQSATELSTTAIFQKGPNIWAQVKNSFQLLKKTPEDIETKTVIERLHIDVLTPILRIILGSAALIGLIGAWWLRRFLSKKRAILNEQNSEYLLLRTGLAVLHKHSYGLCILGLLSLVFMITLLAQGVTPPAYVIITYVLLAYTVVIGILEFLFYPPDDEMPYISFNHAPRYFFLSLKSTVQLIALGLIVYTLLQEQEVQQVAIFLGRSVFVTLLTINLLFVLVFFNQLPKFMARHKNARAFLSLLSVLFFVGIIVTEWTGYQSLSRYLLEGVAFTCLVTFLAWLANHLIQKFLRSFDHHKYKWQLAFHDMLGIKKTDSIPEMFGLRMGFFLLVWGIYIIAIMNIWNVTHTWAHQINVILSTPIVIPNTEVSFIPSRVIIGFIIFSFGVMLTRFIKTKMLRRVSSSKHKAEREAYAGIFGYTGFAVAFFFAMVIAGVNLKGLAIIAGALSVGIGFGLQNIVSNFVSGIILLLERPIKPGDRIALGTEEGYVKKVSIRSTVINTVRNVDIIIPNAELISTQVVNQTFNNYRYRVSCDVGVAYGSDIRLVEKCLFEAALTHPEVIKEGSDKPKVFFLGFGDSSLNFSLWVSIRNVNLKYMVLSELNFAVDDIFRKNNITIPFPQRDVHIINKPSNPPPLEGDQDVDSNE